MLRDAGAVLLGKTHTTAFAYFDPAPTRNPRDRRRTPGGSSSGSAAAVAAGMVPFTLGSQTQGSILRPASYCGVTGFKPTFGRLPADGVLPFAPSLDTPGLFTEAAGDMALLWQLGFGGKSVEPCRRLGLAAPLPGFNAPGFVAARVELPAGFERLLPAVKLINDYEGARTHRTRWERYGERIGRRMAQMVERGLRIPEPSYTAALAYVAALRRRMEAVFRDWPVLVTPAAVGPAPLGLESTGDPAPNAPWTGLGVPAISVPLAESQGLPVGLQLTAAWGDDDRLLATAAALEHSMAGRIPL
jgi:Asp-tRNA(Asn)/Glu-tRNA(Gln) amidotransferase A subunit family amidase